MKTMNFWRTVFSIAVKGGVLSIVALVMLPLSGRAQCAQWDLSGNWSIQQANTVVKFTISQNGSLLTGRASYQAPGKVTKVLGVQTAGTDSVYRNGDIDGSAKGSVFTVKVYWDGNHTVGVYTGTISPTGKIEGDVYGEENPSVKVRWYSRNSMTCAPAPVPATKTPPPPPPIVKTVKSTGKPKLPDNVPATAAPANEGMVPMISATPNNIAFVPGKIGHTVIKWDGGPDHPYAELWVKIDDQDEKFVIEQGKGNRQMVVEPGKSYLYVLTDSGVQLATVTVRFH